MHPGTDCWMKGDRFGEVVRINRTKLLVHVRLDKSGKIVKVAPAGIDPRSFDPGRSLILG
jgi:hypothetical protein